MNMVINRIPDDYFEMILLHKLNRYSEYSTRVDKQICRLSDNRLSVFDAGIDNLFHCNMENNTLNNIIGNIFQRNVGITQQIRGLIFQNEAYIVRHNLRRRGPAAPQAAAGSHRREQEQQELLISQYKKLYLLACKKDDTYKYNVSDDIKNIDSLYMDDAEEREIIRDK